MKQINFHLALYPDTFLWINEQKGIFYNTREHSTFLFDITNLIKNYCTQLQRGELIGFQGCLGYDYNQDTKSISINEKEYQCQELAIWIQKICLHNVGFFIKHQYETPSPISFPPLLNLQSDIDRIEAAEDRDVGEYAAQNWNEFSIYLGGESKFPNLHKQIPYPVDDSSILPFYDLQAFLSSSDNSYLNTINIIGNPFSYPYKAELMDLLYSIPVKKNFYLTASTACRFIKEIQQIDLPNYELYIYYEQEEASIHHILTEKQIPFHWIYLISSEKQYEDLEKLETKYGNEYVEVHPIYTGDNLPFFEENVYLAEEDILQSNYDKQDIFAHQVMNTNFWGRLSVLPDGKVYSNLNHPPLGTLKDRVYDLIVDEMTSKRAWRWIRDEVSPCKDCLFRYLCPSPSNYELVIGKPNLCHVKP